MDGKDARSLFTQFEPADARRFLPSWDEPSFKASFDLTVTVPAGQMAVGNMPVATRKPAGNGRDLVTFQTTPRMSTYLFFLAVGDMERIATKAGKTEIGIVTSRGQAKMAQFALESEARIVPYYNDYFGTDFPLPKLDTVAGPGRSQFFGAMENWGAIFTFEYALLNDPKLTTPAQYQDIFSVGAHETAHQWFGDLVTMKWWDDLWLNEGFASWMEAKATHHFFPEWESNLEDVSGREGAMGLDGRITTHPVIQKIETVDQANQAFDAISYQKGQAVITMLEGFAGEDVWRDGLRVYMKRHAYANTVTNDLWQAMENAGAKGLTIIAHDFTMQPGVPLIKVTGARCANGATQLSLAQGEFSSDRKDKTDAAPLRWHVPVAASTLDGKTARTVVEGGAGTLTVPGCGAVLLNAGQAGYYRTLYAPEQLAALKAGFAQLRPIDQYGLVADQLALSRAGYQPMSAGLDLLTLVGSGNSAKLQYDLVTRWTDLYGLFNDEPAIQAAIAARVSALYGPRADAARLRVQARRAAGRHGPARPADHDARPDRRRERAGRGQEAVRRARQRSRRTRRPAAAGLAQHACAQCRRGGLAEAPRHGQQGADGAGARGALPAAWPGQESQARPGRARPGADRRAGADRRGLAGVGRRAAASRSHHRLRPVACRSGRGAGRCLGPVGLYRPSRLRIARSGDDRQAARLCARPSARKLAPRGRPVDQRARSARAPGAGHPRRGQGLAGGEMMRKAALRLGAPLPFSGFARG